MARWRDYDAEKDEDAVARIWREVGWIDGDSESDRRAFGAFARGYRGIVADINGSAECYVATGSGSMRYQESELPLSMVAAVTTSHVARRQGLGGELTAASIARDAAAGAMVSTLGIFDQGYYDRLGFGTGGYELWRSFDPATLRVPVKPRPPIRITADDWERVHAARHRRMRGHGGVNIDAGVATEAEMIWATNGFGLGYADGPNGELTHFFWVSSKKMEFGPWNVWFMAYQTPEQFLELMALFQTMGDQVILIRMREPALFQIQDLIDTPFRRHRISEKSEYETRANANAYWQMRICDIAGCFAAVRYDGPQLRFNARVGDPIESMLPDDAPWRGVAGDYVIELGSASSATPGHDESLPTLEASVGALTRMWLGVLSASGLAVTDDLSGPADLLAGLDRALLLPTPNPDWDF
jgi:hypothetical protein